jgi:hypothetical protein
MEVRRQRRIYQCYFALRLEVRSLVRTACKVVLMYLHLRML